MWTFTFWMTAILVLCLVYLSCCSLYPSGVEMFDVEYTKEETLQKIRTMLREINQLFRENHITYMMDCGTLLGALRHQDIIPWDDDADLAVINDDGKAEQKLLSLTIMLRNMGYGLSKFWGGYKIYYLNGEDIKKDMQNWQWQNKKIEKDDKQSAPYKFPFVDILFMERKGDKYDLSCPKAKSVWPNFYHMAQDVFPLKEYKFNDFTLLGPQNPGPYLNRAYGDDWKTTAYKDYDHSSRQKLYSARFNLA